MQFDNSRIVFLTVNCSKEHPHHALPVLLTQAMLHKDKEITKTGGFNKMQVEVGFFFKFY